MKRPGIALLLGLVLASSSCGLVSGDDPAKTREADPAATAAAAEDPPPDVTVTGYLDPDPRFEVRVVDFAGGLRPTITTRIDPELIALGAKAIFGGISQADIEAYAVGRTVDTATHVINMTSRDFSFLRLAR